VRSTLDRMARGLRNMASPTDITSVAGTLPRAIDRNQSFDLVFKDVQDVKVAGSLNTPNVRRVRFCLDKTTATNGKLWQQIQTWTTAAFPALPASTSCPGTAWPTTKLVGENVVNGARPIFYYNATDPRDVTEVTSTLYVDVNPARDPTESTLQSSVYLRNQNRKPNAVFSLALANSGTTIIMNASESTDPEEKPLSFTWYIDGTEVVGEGANDVVHTATVTAGTHTVKVAGSDGPLEDISDTQSICVPAPAQGVTC